MYNIPPKHEREFNKLKKVVEYLLFKANQGGGVGTLQQVTDLGNVTTNNIEVTNNTQSHLSSTNVGFTRGSYMDSLGYLNLLYDDNYIDMDPNTFKMYWKNATGILTIGSLHTAARAINYPDATGTLALISDTKAIEMGFAAGDEASDTEIGTSVLTFRMPFAITLTNIIITVNTAPTGSTLICDLNKDGVSVLSTKVSIDIGEETSNTAAIPPVISDSALSINSEITLDIDQVGSTIAGTGLKIWLIGTKV